MSKRLGIKFTVIAVFLGIAVFYAVRICREHQMLRKVIERLTADSRIAQVLVTKVQSDPETLKSFTTIKFLEYDSQLNPLPAKYFTFSGNIIQFQSLVIRFDDDYVKQAHPLKGKSAYLFMRAFSLTDEGPEIFDINKVNEVPAGYRVDKARNVFEEQLWRRFWNYALEPKEAKKIGIKNAQIEAPGSKFIPGMLYTLKIEHDGGMRIDVEPLPKILEGESIPAKAQK
ncbi:MAG: hypothetical protein ABIG31_04620 [Candidatus Omnitrophota bacterium]